MHPLAMGQRLSRQALAEPLTPLQIAKTQVYKLMCSHSANPRTASLFSSTRRTPKGAVCLSPKMGSVLSLTGGRRTDVAAGIP